MSAIEKRIEELGYKLPSAPGRGGVYTPCKIFGDGKLAYVSGCGPAIGETNFKGKLGGEVSFEDGSQAARNCLLNVLAVLKSVVGDLDNVKSCVKMLVFVASTTDFYEQPQVANAATKLLVDIFGEEIGCPSRSAIGVNVLPGNIAVEIELLVELK
jgi:enamine deaminase RidA (YjgF/YER057c/UK114 family)